MNQETIENQDDPTAIKYINDIVKDSESDFNNFLAFKTINNLYLLIYIKKGQNSIISYNLNNNKKINEIKNAHLMPISQLKYFYDKIENRDLIISVSIDKIKLWNISNMECLYNFINTKKNIFLFAACFFSFDNKNYIITTTDEENAPMTLYDFKGNIIKNVYYSSRKLFIDSFQNKKLLKNYIIFANNKDVKSYDFNKGELFHIYSDYKSRYFYDQFKHVNVLINSGDNIVKLIFLNSEKFIRIYDFYTGALLNIIDCIKEIKEICLWNCHTLFITHKKNFLLFDLKNEDFINEVKIDKEENVINIKKIFLPKYGNCLILLYKKGIIRLFNII